MSPRPRQLRKKLAISFATVLVVVLIGEVAVRLFADVHRPILVVDATLGRRFVDNFEGDIFNEEAQRDVPLRFNQHGLRFAERTFEKPPGVHRLLLVGDSFIAGVEVNEENTTCVRLEELLAATRPEERWEVLNFGVLGSAPDQEYVLYRELGAKFNADLVLCTYFVGNDFMGLSTELCKATKIYFELDENAQLAQVPYPSLRVSFNELLNEYSRLYVWQKLKVNESRESVGVSLAADLHGGEADRRSYHGYELRKSEWVYCQEETEVVRKTWAVTDALMAAFAKEVEGDGAQFGVVLMPAPEQLFDEDFEFVRELAGDLGERFSPTHPNERLQALCDKIGVPFLDLLPALREATPSHAFAATDEWLQFNGTGHLNERGHEIVAHALLQEILKTLPPRASTD